MDGWHVGYIEPAETDLCFFPCFWLLTFRGDLGGGTAGGEDTSTPHKDIPEPRGFPKNTYIYRSTQNKPFPGTSCRKLREENERAEQKEKKKKKG